MMRYSPILLLAIPMLACALSFEERVDAGYQSSETKYGRDYENSIGIFVGKVMRKCVPTNGDHTLNTADFILVSWIDSIGAVIQPDVQPKNALSRCFLKGFAREILPYPPKMNMQTQGYPLTIYMKITE